MTSLIIDICTGRIFLMSRSAAYLELDRSASKSGISSVRDKCLPYALCPPRPSAPVRPALSVSHRGLWPRVLATDRQWSDYVTGCQYYVIAVRRQLWRNVVQPASCHYLLSYLNTEPCISYQPSQSNTVANEQQTPQCTPMPSSSPTRSRQDKTRLSCSCRQCEQKCRRKFRNCFAQSGNAVRTTENSLDLSPILFTPPTRQCRLVRVGGVNQAYPGRIFSVSSDTCAIGKD